jgi:hypothetical protein
MRVFSFEPNRGRPLTRWVDAKGVAHVVDPKTSKVVIAPVFASNAPSRFACFHIGPGGFIPRHPAVGAQLFAVVEGAGWVSGSDGNRIPIRAGQAAYWESDELHESGTDKGMRVIVVEGDSFDPGAVMREVRV